MAQQKTIFITVPETFILKSVAGTSFMEDIQSAAGEARFVLITVPELEETLKNEFGSKGFIVETLESEATFYLDTLLSFLARAGFYTGMNDVQQRRAWYSGASRIPPVFKRIFGKTIGRTNVFVRVLRWLDLQISPSSRVAHLFDHYQPEKVFSTVLLSGAVDLPVLREAKRRNVYTLAMTRSWDNFTGYGYVRIVPDKYLAQNDFLADIASQFQFIKRSNTRVVGIPHYDLYLDTTLQLSREEFCTQMGIDPKKKIIVYGAVGEPLFRHEREMSTVLQGLIDEGEIKQSSQVIYRPHPAYPVDELPGGARHVILDNKKLDSLPHLINTLLHADVLVTAGSTLIIDTSCFDTPIVTVAFDGISGEVNPWFSTRCFYEHFDHLKALFRTARGARIVNNPSELACEINAYIEHPQRDTSERKKIVEYFAAPFDGHSGERLAREVVRA